MKREKQSRKSVIFDTLFIMMLCFATLLTTMVIQGGVIVGGEGSLSYSIKLPSFVLTMGGLFVYLVFTLKESDKELKKMISFIYEGEAAKLRQTR
ncbi:hypothetical protein SAMN02745751_02828 [Dethiosulfatibacter aminovorans DSM 17477]|uniref:Uncharacterized protein n=1 Tax=Dethiosulfatibacter aminovorans DSM 17477 TaxID=1121476 RepID=A0A1M6K967_9FIRM|nr:hypothetical protein [Dethiosulfatibacter aminovorans]SHJ55465.1 hypothetical protein SAMN02745751_02828 [Dethiosulfatibacter aminovorans DSM 17477]